MALVKAAADPVREILDCVRGMARRDHQPTPCLLVRLTDGRVKLARVEGRREASERLQQIRNEYGPVSLAVSILVEGEAGDFRVQVEDVTRSVLPAFDQACAVVPMP